MPTNIKLLIVDDHQLIIEGILFSLKEINNLDISTTNSCDEAYALIQESLNEIPFQIVFTDLSFDNTTLNSVIKSGEELIKKLKKEEIPIKIGVITGHSETNRVFNVLQHLNPDAYILKGQCSGDELNFAIHKMLKNEPFYTHEIHQKLTKRAMVEIQMDDIALQILKELRNHSKINNLEGVIKKSNGSLVKTRTIEAKLAKLRGDLNANNNTDLVLKAMELGILD